jgi:tRNA (guanine37-N1)-methyltransferase
VRIDVISIFVDYFAPLELSLIGKARAKGLLDVHLHDLRTWTSDVHRTVDDAPYGGGPGMVMRPEPWWTALTEVTAQTGPAARPRILVPTPSGRPFDQALAAELAAEPWLLFCCGRYEGIDARVIDQWADDEVSLGDYVLAGGEVATLVMVEAVTRLLPGVLGNADSVVDDSFADAGERLLEPPVYTRPPDFGGHTVPPVLLSGDHGAIARWRREESLRRTRERRPDLLGPAGPQAPDPAAADPAAADPVAE